MTAPLHDSRGNVRYYIGAQIDISHLLEGGRGLDSFQELHDQDEEAIERAKHHENNLHHKPSLTLLRELGGLLNEEEIEAVKDRDSGSHAHTQSNRRSNSISSNVTASSKGAVSHRKFVGMEDSIDDQLLPQSMLGANGQLPGVYKNVRIMTSKQWAAC
jgi:hypothetical protein